MFREFRPLRTSDLTVKEVYNAVCRLCASCLCDDSYSADSTLDVAAGNEYVHVSGIGVVCGDCADKLREGARS